MEKNYTNNLLYAIVVMIVPLFLSFHLVKGLSYSILTIGFFLIAIIICNVKDGRIIIGKFSKECMLLIVVFIFFQFISITNGYIIDGFFITNDFFNMIGKAIMIYTFIIIPLGQSVSLKEFCEFTKRFTIISIFICLFNIFDNFNLIIHFFDISNSYQFNVTGVFANRNQFGAFMFISVVVHTYYNTIIPPCRLDCVAYAIQFSNLILSMSRGAMLATGVFLFIYWILYKKIISRYFIPFFVSLVIICVSLTNRGILDFIQKNIIRIDVGNSGRSNVWLTGFEIANREISSLFVGQGLFHGVSIAQSSGMPFDQFHSVYIDTIVSGGIIELLFLVALFTFIILSVAKCPNYKLKWVSLASLFGYLVLCIFESDSVLSIGYVDMINTIMFLTIPLIISRIKNNTLTNSIYKSSPK